MKVLAVTSTEEPKAPMHVRSQFADWGIDGAVLAVSSTMGKTSFADTIGSCIFTRSQNNTTEIAMKQLLVAVLASLVCSASMAADRSENQSRKRLSDRKLTVIRDKFDE